MTLAWKVNMMFKCRLWRRQQCTVLRMSGLNLLAAPAEIDRACHRGDISRGIKSWMPNTKKAETQTSRSGINNAEAVKMRLTVVSLPTVKV